jgi:hypothetical protein
VASPVSNNRSVGKLASIPFNSHLEIPLFAVAAQMRLAQKMRRNTLGFIDLTFYKAILGIPVTPE